MRELMKMISADWQGEGFTRKDFAVYGVAVPMGLLAVAVIASVLK